MVNIVVSHSMLKDIKELLEQGWSTEGLEHRQVITMNSLRMRLSWQWTSKRVSSSSGPGWNGRLTFLGGHSGHLGTLVKLVWLDGLQGPKG